MTNHSRLFAYRFMTRSVCLALGLLTSILSFAQMESATMSGTVMDRSGAVVADTKIEVTNSDTNVKTTTTTNKSGTYVVTGLRPGRYRMAVSKEGFRSIVVTDITLNVQDVVSRNFNLDVGAFSESITVTADTLNINTTDASVSTVIDRHFVESLPLNGRSFNTLLQLTPGVVIAPNTSGANSQGQFSIAGQRTDANSFTVDGVSANFGVGAGTNAAQSGTGGAQALSVLGGTSSLVSVDALQEFRIETSSFAPEFGKTPGGQVILTTRSGTNDFHGGVFDYFRNTVMDANDWFAKQAGHPRAAEHHNDFGGFLGGPLRRDKTFLFFSYEGARLLLPQTQVIQVPFLNGTTCSASAAIAPYLNAYPKPNGTVSPTTCTGQFTGGLSNPAVLNATSLRIDQTVNQRFTMFARYNYAPSRAQSAFGPSSSLSNPLNNNVDTQMLTVGVNMLLSSRVSNIVRGNYSAQLNKLAATLDTFGGAVPLSLSLLLGTLSPAQNAAYFQTFDVASYNVGYLGQNRTQQVNLVDDLAVTLGSHLLKVGGDYRSIFLDEAPSQNEFFYTAPTVSAFLSSGSVSLSAQGLHASQFLAQSFSLYAQDTWKATPRLTLTYGLRWELAPAPAGRGKTTLAAWQNVNDPANTALAPAGTSLWATTYGNFAPRLGIAYSLTPNGDFVVRAGAGIFYDLGVGESANLAFNFPNFASTSTPTVTLPIADISPFVPTNFSRQPPYGFSVGFDPHLELPRSYQWNVALEKSFHGKQVVSATYVGQSGRDLLRNEAIFQPNSNFNSDFILTYNGAHSNYNALQVQYRRPLSSRLQALLNYTWSHSLDNASDDVVLGLPSSVVSGASDYASSSFDVRQSLSGAIRYDIPAAAKSGAIALLTGHWSLQSVIVARRGFPFSAVVFSSSPDLGGSAQSRPDLAPGQPLWISDRTAGGGKSLNPNAFSIPSTPRQGTEGRNDISGFGLTQVDLSIERKFPITERINLQFRTDAFNVFNHPNFANPFAYIEFGPSYLKSSEMLNQGLGGLGPLFQEGGPRSLQVSLKLTF
jgi:carboxypeptidase family protein/TonB-dependent receptor-like protein